MSFISSARRRDLWNAYVRLSIPILIAVAVCSASYFISDRNWPLYAAMAILIILHCAIFGWAAYDLFTAVPAHPVTRNDALYFSTVTFTTVGYGDFVPRAGAGRLLAGFEALLGTAHAVFFILVFLRGGTPTSAPPAGTEQLLH